MEDPIVEVIREMGRAGLESDKALLGVCDALKDRINEQQKQIESLQDTVLTLAKQLEAVLEKLRLDKFNAQYEVF